MRPIVWTAAARYDVAELVAYIAADSPGAARRVRDRIVEVADRLAQFATGRPGAVTGTYEQVVPRLPYIVIYRIRREAGAESIRILRVLHTARDRPG
jgi:plasmid stabilization system protein ParE